MWQEFFLKSLLWFIPDNFYTLFYNTRIFLFHFNFLSNIWSCSLWVSYMNLFFTRLFGYRTIMIIFYSLFFKSLLFRKKKDPPVNGAPSNTNALCAKAKVCYGNQSVRQKTLKSNHLFFTEKKKRICVVPYPSRSVARKWDWRSERSNFRITRQK